MTWRDRLGNGYLHYAATKNNVLLTKNLLDLRRDEVSRLKDWWF